MNDDDKLMQEFMDSLKEEKAENVTPYYKSSSNLNLQLGNPDFNVNNSMAVNIKDTSDINEKSVIPQFSNIKNKGNNNANTVNNINSKNDDLNSIDNTMTNAVTDTNHNTLYDNSKNNIINKKAEQQLVTPNSNVFLNTDTKANYFNEDIKSNAQKKYFASSKGNNNTFGDMKFVVLLALVFLIVVLFLIPSLSDILNNFLLTDREIIFS